ncbi:hypothetical protein GCM10010252_18560 [Streptomyces aureoverticillatus]|nr:hypothetical protein GCM10010252_18560 [Streptomyces aureoverticillatus]
MRQASQACELSSSVTSTAGSALVVSERDRTIRRSGAYGLVRLMVKPGAHVPGPVRAVPKRCVERVREAECRAVRRGKGVRELGGDGGADEVRELGQMQVRSLRGFLQRT